MSAILITNHFLRDFTGSEVACLDLARTLAGAGHQVTVACFDSGEPLNGLFADSNIKLHCLDALAGQQFDLIWAHHFTTLDYCLLDLNISAKTVVFSSLSPYEPLESPPLCLERVNLFLANSPETREALLSMGLGKEQVMLFANPVAPEFFEHKPAPLPEKPRLALVSNHVPPELKAALPRLSEQGIEVTLFGREGRRTLITPELLGEFNGIISIGRTVQYGLAMGLPVFCYDHFAGPGWLTPGNIENAALHNFSGRCTPAPQTAEQLAAAIAGGLSQAHQQAAGFRELARQRFHLKTALAEVLVQANARQPVMAGADAVRLVALRQRDYYQQQQQQPMPACLYADNGEGFDERFTLWHQMRPPYARVQLKLDPAATGRTGPLQGVRLDPLDAPCVVRLHHITLTINGERHNVTDSVTSNALRRESDLYYFLTRDPQWVVPVANAPVQWLEAELEFVALGDDAVAASLALLEQAQAEQQQQQQRLAHRAAELEDELTRLRAHPVWRFLRLLRRGRDRIRRLFASANKP